MGRERSVEVVGLKYGARVSDGGKSRERET